MPTTQAPTEVPPRDSESIHKAVREAYAARVEAGGGCGPATSSCCGPSGTADHDAAAVRMGYDRADLEAVPEGANLGLGCGAPLDGVPIEPGDTVLDLGSGAGFDAFLAARRVGPAGRVIGVDMTPEMVARARRNAATAGAANVEFRLGQIEELPVANDSVDLVISNCVINLSPDKPAVFREAHRVLRPGGRLAVSDIVLTRPLPPPVADSLAAYVGCIAGAALLDDYVGGLREAGFDQVEVVESRPAVEALPADDPVVRAVRDEVAGQPFDLAEVAASVLSAKIVARKAAA